MASPVDAILDAGRAAHPRIAAPRDALARLLHERLADEPNPADLAGEEIYLACACALGDAAAIATFEQRYFAAIPAALSRLGLGRDEIAEVEQILRVRLFVERDPGEPPRVVAYAGHGQLGGLLRVSAVRAGLNLLRDRGRLAPAGDELEDIPIAADDPELARLKQQHRAAFKAAFAEAIATLEPRERALLDFAVVNQLGIDKIAAVYAVHRATAARWVAAAREHLATAVHRALAARLGIRGGELDRLLPLVESQLELSLARLLTDKSSS